MTLQTPGILWPISFVELAPGFFQASLSATLTSMGVDVTSLSVQSFEMPSMQVS